MSCESAIAKDVSGQTIKALASTCNRFDRYEQGYEWLSPRSARVYDLLKIVCRMMREHVTLNFYPTRPGILIHTLPSSLH